MLSADTKEPTSTESVLGHTEATMVGMEATTVDMVVMVVLPQLIAWAAHAVGETAGSAVEEECPVEEAEVGGVTSQT